MYEVTLKDIAEVVGCSVNTVSLALKNSPRISEATRNKIQKAAKDMNYASNNMARALVLKRTGTIGLIIRNISTYYFTLRWRVIYYLSLLNLQSSHSIATICKSGNRSICSTFHLKRDCKRMYCFFRSKFQNLSRQSI